jgi:hypothetical protein
MKKFFIALSVLAALFLTVVPSQALVGMPDRVPANELISIFVVSMTGNLDTLIIINETDGFSGLTPATARAIHWMMWDPLSQHKADRSIRYTPNDVVAISCRDIIFNTLTVNERISLEADLDTDGVNESYIGYVTWNDEVIATGVEQNDFNHFVGKMYVVDLNGGIGSGISIAGRESFVGIFNQMNQGSIVPPYILANYQLGQSEATSILPTWLAPGSINMMEGWSPLALAMSRYRNAVGAPVPAAVAPATGLPAWFRMIPRWYLYTDAGENNIFVWKSFNSPNQGALFPPANWSFSAFIYDNDEHPTSKQINLPRELNYIDIREIVPPDWIPASGTMAGWVDIRLLSNSGAVGNPAGWQYMDFLCYSWQRSNNASASLNWSALFESHREAGSLNLIP